VAKDTVLPNIKEIFSMGITLLLTVFAFIFFRAKSVNAAFAYIEKIFSGSFLNVPNIENISRIGIGSIFLSIPVLIIIEWINRKEEYSSKKQSKYKTVRWLIYSIITLMILELAGQEQGFIYFQF
jgi:quinol-cytochrome oxidoreductase complex cytochrome b subunit